jgi:hypothetical protein
MKPRDLLGRAGLALISAAFVLSACGGTTPTAAPSSGAATTPPVTTAPASEAPATEAPATEAPATEAPATEEPATGEDPMDDLQIAAPYEFAPLDETIARLFEDQMERSLGEMAGAFDIGFRSANRGGETDAFVIAMRFPDLPITTKKLIETMADGMTASGGSVETVQIGGEPAKVVSVQGQTLVISAVGRVIIMSVGTAKKATVNVATAIAEAN